MRLGASTLDDWQLWFAWFPVRVRGQWVWLETIKRMRVCHFGCYYIYRNRNEYE
jgi:hypothetical protein